MQQYYINANNAGKYGFGNKGPKSKKSRKGTKAKVDYYKKLNEEEFNETYDEREAAVRIEKAGYLNGGSPSYNYWICKGKYYGIPMSKLPASYLSWVVNNFDEESTGFQYAKHEIEKRFAKL